MIIYAEGWAQAQHDSGVREFLARCSKVADGKATEEIPREDVEGVFIPKADLAGPVFHGNEAVVLDILASLDAIYEGCIRKKAQYGITGYEPLWNARGQVQALLTGDSTSERKS